MLTTLLLLQVALPAPSWTRPPVPLADPKLSESSALVRSTTQPGLFWTLNDSDNPPQLFATDTAGHALGTWLVRGATNQDWEALAEGPCPSTGGRPKRDCLYIGDIGDNNRKRPFITIYRVREPRPGDSTPIPILDSLHATYPDGPRDAEAMVVDDAGTTWIISKELLQSPRIYRLNAGVHPWPARTDLAMTFVDTLPIPSASGAEFWVTDASWNGARDSLFVRTYGALFALPVVRGRPVATATRALCQLIGLGPQGEGVAWLGGGYFALSSEKLFRSPASIALARCAG